MIKDLINNKLVLKSDNNEYSAKKIVELIDVIIDELNEMEMENKLVTLCLSDSFTQFILSTALWDKNNVIMYVNSQNGKEYADKIINHYEPRYIFMGKSYYEQNSENQWRKRKEFELEGKIIVICERACDDDYLKDFNGCVFFSSGTTDVPKAVFRSGINMKNDAISNIVSFDITSEDKLLLAVPFGHVYGLGSGVIPFALQGATVYFASPFVTGRGLKRIIETEKITAIISSPTVYQEILQTNVDLSSCRLMLSAGSKLSNKLIEDFYQKYGKVINNMYGSSETGAIATVYGDDLKETENTNCGRPMHSISVSCEGTVEKEGIIKVKSLSIADGILKDRKVVPLTDEDGWFEMSDMGYLDEKGCIHLVCRKDDMINIGGEKLSPKTIEKLVENYYEQALVLTEIGEDGACYPILYIEADSIEFDMLYEKLKERLSYKFMPRKIFVYERFPRNNNGKIDRNRLREGKDRRTEYECC